MDSLAAQHATHGILTEDRPCKFELCISILPIYRNETCAAGWDSVSVIGAPFPGHRAIGSDFYEFELDGCPRWHRSIDEPVWIVRRKHRPHGRVERRAPITKLHCVASEEDVITYVGG